MAVWETYTVQIGLVTMSWDVPNVLEQVEDCTSELDFCPKYLPIKQNVKPNLYLF